MSLVFKAILIVGMWFVSTQGSPLVGNPEPYVGVVYSGAEGLSAAISRGEEGATIVTVSEGQKTLRKFNTKYSLCSPVLLRRGTIVAASYDENGPSMRVLCFSPEHVSTVFEKDQAPFPGVYGYYPNGARHPGVPTAMKVEVVPESDYAVLLLFDVGADGQFYSLLIVNAAKGVSTQVVFTPVEDKVALWDAPPKVGAIVLTRVTIPRGGSIDSAGGENGILGLVDRRGSLIWTDIEVPRLSVVKCGPEPGMVRVFDASRKITDVSAVSLMVEESSTGVLSWTKQVATHPTPE